MTLVSLTLPSDGQTAHVADVNGPFNALANVINGNLDSTNIASLSGTKIQTGTLPSSAFNAAAAQGWQSVGQTFTYTGNNGNKEYTGTFGGDVTSVLSIGNRLQLTRSTTAPTQSMAFSTGSSQFASKASPTGLTDTGVFTCEAWIYLNSYSANDQGIISRDSGGASGGFGFYIVAATGQLSVFWRNASGNSQLVSSQAVPLHRWVHAAVAVTSITSAAANFYLNGALIPATVSSSVATTRLQSGSLQVGAYNSTKFFDGYISEARYWAQTQSQSSVQANMAINVVGSESGLGAAFRGNGTFADQTANNNTLSAQNGAIATQASNPYNNVEYAKITKVGAFSAGVTPVTFFAGTDYNIPNMVLSNALYSNQDSPFGFPNGREKWIVDTLTTAQTSFSPGNQTAWTNIGNVQLAVPTGEWESDISGMSLTTSVSSPSNYPTQELALSTSSNSLVQPDRLVEGGAQAGGNNTAQATIPFFGSTSYATTSMTTLYLVERDNTGGTNGTIFVGSGGTRSPHRIRMRLAY